MNKNYKADAAATPTAKLNLGRIAECYNLSPIMDIDFKSFYKFEDVAKALDTPWSKIVFEYHCCIELCEHFHFVENESGEAGYDIVDDTVIAALEFLKDPATVFSAMEGIENKVFDYNENLVEAGKLAGALVKHYFEMFGHYACLIQQNAKSVDD